MPTHNYDLTVIIPCRNDAAALSSLLTQLGNQQAIQLQIIVADGQSSDDSIAVAQGLGAQTIHCQTSRATQMNAAAAHAAADWLLFLHADSQLSAPRQLSKSLKLMQAQSPQTLVAGHFALSFIDRPAQQKRWRVLEYKTTTNLPLTISGDQGLLIRLRDFQQLGGFNTELPFLEDQRFAEKIHKQGQWLLLPGTLKTSARRFASQGFAGGYLLMTLIMLAYRCGLTNFLNPAKLYPEQKNAQRIKLWPHIKHLHHCAWQQGCGAAFSFYWQTAALCRDNLYQLPLWLDALLGLERWPISRLWRKVVEPIIQLPVLKTLIQIISLPVMPLISALLIAAKL